MCRFSKLSIAVACALGVHGAYAQGQQGERRQAAQSDEILEYVIVTGSQVTLPPEYAGGQVARGGRVGLFGNLDMMDTPFNTTNYTADFMRNLQARSVADVVQSDPGVRVARGFGNFQELYVVRGLPIHSDDMSYNGLYGLLPRQYIAAEFLERVEVFRGANSFINGAAPGGSGLGGSFNLVPKRAPDNDLNRLSLGFENDGQGYAAADFARRFGFERRFGLRFNAAMRDGDTSVEDESRELGMLSVGIDYHGERARFSADFGWQDHHIDAPRPSVTPFGGIPKPPDADKNFTQKWSFTDERDLFAVARGEFEFTDSTTGWAATGVREGKEHNVLANPSSDAAGNTTTYRFDNTREDLVTTSEIGLRTEFATGSVGHSLSTSASIYKLDSKNAYAFSDFAGFANNLYDSFAVAAPVPDFFIGGVLSNPKTTSEIETASIAVADTLSFANERVRLTLGARYQVLEQRTYDYNTGVEDKTQGYDESTVTPVAGLVVKPSDRFSIYANYAEGLVQGGVVPAFVSGYGVPANQGEVFDPFKSKQFEVGVKYDRGDLGATLAIFRVNKPSTRLDGTTGIMHDDGEQRNEGIELSWYGAPMESLRVLGGITLLSAELQKTSDLNGDGVGDNNGNDAIGVPDVQANVGLEWDVPGTNGLSLDGRFVYTSSQAADEIGLLEIPSWTRLDIGARYAFRVAERTVSVRARVDNVTDENDWVSVGGFPGSNYLVLGLPRTFVVSASIDF